MSYKPVNIFGAKLRQEQANVNGIMSLINYCKRP